VFTQINTKSRRKYFLVGFVAMVVLNFPFGTVGIPEHEITVVGPEGVPQQGIVVKRTSKAPFLSEELDKRTSDSAGLVKFPQRIQYAAVLWRAVYWILSVPVDIITHNVSAPFVWISTEPTEDYDVGFGYGGYLSAETPSSEIIRLRTWSDSLELERSAYPKPWFEYVETPNEPFWEIFPHEAGRGEVILSKRNELGILSNFAATPFELDGKRYASVEGFWQMMLYPEGPDDERAKDKRVTWKYTREQVAQMTAFEAKAVGTLAEENMKTLGIDWVTYNGKRFPYHSQTPGEHYRLIVTAMRAKLEQNPEVKRILLATGDLILKPDHQGEENPPPEWKYYEIWMLLRSELQKPAR
jgi:predicted NAD-dependent protein-ADP-ribosyltransferase YbiA (DUF1768 family)